MHGRPESPDMFETIVVATDGSRSVGRAVSVALDLAERFDAAVHALYVVDVDEVDSSPDRLRGEMEEALVERGEEALDDGDEHVAGQDGPGDVVDGREQVLDAVLGEREDVPQPGDERLPVLEEVIQEKERQSDADGDVGQGADQRDDVAEGADSDVIDSSL